MIFSQIIYTMMRGIYKLIQDKAYKVLVDNRRNALLCSGKKVL